MKFASKRMVLIGTLGTTLLLLLNGYISYTQTQNVRRANEDVSRYYELVSVIDQTLSLMKDAETGTRGYVITGDETYLEPFLAAQNQVPTQVRAMRQLIRQVGEDVTNMQPLEQEIDANFLRLRNLIDLRRREGFDAAQQIVQTDEDKQRMDTIRALSAQLRANEEAELQRRITASAASMRSANTTFVLATVLSLGLLASLYTIIRNDLAQRQHAAAALHESEAQRAAIVNSAMDAIISVNEQQRIVVFNSAAEQMFKISARQVFGEALDRFVPVKARSAHRNHLPTFGQTGTTNRSMHSLQPLTAVRANGEVFLIEASISQVTVSGSKLYTAVIRDITERQQAENERVRLLEQEHAARAEAEAARKRLEMVVRVSTVLGRSLELPIILATIVEEIARNIGDSCTLQLVSDDNQLLVFHNTYHPNPEVRAFSEQVLGEPLRIENSFAKTVFETGDPLLVQHISMDQWKTILKPEFWADAERFGGHSVLLIALKTQNRIIGILNLTRDITATPYTTDDQQLAQEIADRAALAIENARLYSEAQNAIRLREVFLSIAAHELKTPLTTLLGYIFVLQRRLGAAAALNQRDERALHQINEQGHRLDRLINTLLDVSRIQLGRLAIERQPVNLARLVERIAGELRPQLEKHTLKVCIHAEPIVLGDELRLEQVLHNLIGNAIKYSPEGGPVGVEVNEAGPCAVLAVHDQGIGIPAAAQPRLFTQFFRASNVDPQKISGLGVGLYVVHEIVTLHSGTLTVNSQEHIGSSFFVELPRRLAAPASQPDDHLIGA